jgi:hypothetical protein
MMKRILFALCACSVIGALARAEKPVIPVDTGYIRASVEAMTSLQPPRNYSNLRSLDSCANYIRNEFNKTGGRIGVQTFIVNDNTYRNVICSFGPEAAGRIIIGAHYDVCGDQPGADDNASGVAGLLEIARLIGSLQPALRDRIDLVAYSLEEPPFYHTHQMGSYFHAKALADSAISVKAMISLEMIGYYSDLPHSQEYPFFLLKLFYPTTGNFVLITGKSGDVISRLKHGMKEASTIPVRTFRRGIELSDHINYWSFGFPAVMVTNTAFYRNINYHQASDTPATLDYARLAEVVKGVYWAVVNGGFK